MDNADKCPKCKTSIHLYFVFKGREGLTIKCFGCKSEGFEGSTKDEAIHNWNSFVVGEME